LPEINGKEIFEKRNVGLYLHIPFCARLCFFCPYTKYLAEKKTIQLYLKALKKEIKMISFQPSARNTAVSAVFFGGGTPTILSGKELAELLSFCRKHFNFTENCQITVEANPNTVDGIKLAELNKAGFNRISFGVQSFNDKILRLFGSHHNSLQAAKAIKLSAENGFTNINLDLMYRLPGQEKKEWKKDLEKAMNSGASHITTYALDVVPGTALLALKQKNKLEKIPSFRKEKEMAFLADKLLKEKGFKRYMIDQFALKNKENLYAVHTLSGEVIGLGCGAFSHFNGFEYRNFTDIRKYTEKINKGKFAVERGKKLTKKEEMERFMIKNLLFLEISPEDFRERFGVELKKVFGKKLKKLEKQKFISMQENKIKVTRKGMHYIYSLCREFYSKEYSQIIAKFEEKKMKA
jgi:oxygen-independent coproporphyrinogen-3 oxidase